MLSSSPSTPRSTRLDRSPPNQNNTTPGGNGTGSYHSSVHSSPSSSPTDTEALWTPPLLYKELEDERSTGSGLEQGLSEKTPTQATFRGLGLATMQADQYSVPAAGSSMASGSSSRRTSIRSTLAPEAATRRESDDDVLVMRDRNERDGQGSVGRAGGVDVGMTRPKRRLSSLPSLPHPFLGDSRAYSTSSPPSSPRYASSTSSINPTYQSLVNGGMGAGAAPVSGSGYPGTRLSEKMSERSTYQPAGASKEAKSDSPRLFGIELKWISLLTLALQNAFLTIIMHYSRITAIPNKTYSAASAVLLNELLKGTISCFIALRNIDKSLSSPSHPSSSEKDALARSPLNRPSAPGILASRFSLFAPSRLSALRRAVFSRDCVKLSIPAILYVIQNNLQYVAASNLDVATFQVTYQMKILTTAAFSVVMLRKRLSRMKWLSLFLLAVGVGIVQIQSSSAPSHTAVSKNQHALRSEADSTAATEQIITALHVMSPLKGFLAVTAACLTSGLAGVYFELLLKSGSSAPAPAAASGSGSSGSGGSSNSQPDLWVRNTQLSLFSLIPAIMPILFNGSSDGLSPIGRLFAAFANFNGWAVGTVLTQTFGGLITAIVIRYSDNIMKGFATSLSIIISFLASVALFSYPITFAFVLGSSVVLAATFLYNAPTSSSASVTRREMAIPPGSPILTSAPIIGEPEKPSRASSVISLLGLVAGSRPGSRAPSRAPSGENLRHMASLSNLTPFGTPGRHSAQSSLGSLYGGGGGAASPHIYAASAPGTPYFSGLTPGQHTHSGSNGHGSTSSISSNPYETAFSGTNGRISPNITPLPPRLRSPMPGEPPAYGPGAGFAHRKDSSSGESTGSSGSSGSGTGRSPPRLKLDVRGAQ